MHLNLSKNIGWILFIILLFFKVILVGYNYVFSYQNNMQFENKNSDYQKKIDNKNSQTYNSQLGSFSIQNSKRIKRA